MSKDKFILKRRYTFHQKPEYPTGCEISALHILLRYNGVDVDVSKLANMLKLGPLPHEENGKIFGGNPEVEFIGNPRKLYSFGVYNGPIADLARYYKAGVKSRVGVDFKEVLTILKEGRAVMVWTTINNTVPFISKEWIYEKTGEKIRWISGEHAVVLIGYSKRKVIVSDPYKGKIRKINREKFISRYDYLGKRVIYF